MSYDNITAQLEPRHWWLVSKLQESFGDQLRSTNLERFLCQPETVPALTAFAHSRARPERRSLFVSKQRAEDGATRFFTSFTSPTELISKVSYFVRRRAGEPDDRVAAGSASSAVGEDADQAFQDSVLWGEVDPDLMSDMKASLRDVCTPLLEANTDWGECSRESIQQLFATVDRFVSSLPGDAESLKNPLHIPQEVT